MATPQRPNKSSNDHWKNDRRQVYVEIPEPSEELERLLRTYVRIRYPPSGQSPSSSRTSRSPSTQSSQPGPSLSHSGLVRSRPGPFTFSAAAASPQLPTRYASLPRKAPKQFSLSRATPVHRASTISNTVRQAEQAERRSAAGPSSLPKKKTKLIFSHVEITNLDEVLSHQKWQNVRAGFMRELRKRRAQKLADQGKGKGKAIPQDEDSEAQVDTFLQGHASASSFSPRRSSHDGRSPIFLGTLPPSHRPRKRISYTKLGGFDDDDEDFNLRDIELFGDDDSDEFVPSDKERKSRKMSRSRSGLFSQGSIADEEVLQVEVEPTPKKRKGRPPKSPSQAEPSSSQISDKRHPTFIAAPKRKRRPRRSSLPPSDSEEDEHCTSSASEWEAPLETKMLNATGRPRIGPKSKMVSGWSHTRTLYSNRKCQRPLVEFTAEEERQLEKECAPRSCHMCHKKKWVMCCTGDGSPDGKKCTAAFCDRCLARYPLPFDPFASFLCPKCIGNCICSACVVLHEPDSVLGHHASAAQAEVALGKAAGKAKLLNLEDDRSCSAEIPILDPKASAPRRTAPPSEPDFDSNSTGLFEQIVVPELQYDDIFETLEEIELPPSAVSSLTPLPDSYAPTASSPSEPPEYAPFRLCNSPLFPSSLLIQDTLNDNLPPPTRPGSPSPIDGLPTPLSFRLLRPPTSPALSPASSLHGSTYFETSRSNIDEALRQVEEALATKPQDRTYEQCERLAESCRVFYADKERFYSQARKGHGPGFLGLDPMVALPGQTWAGDVGMFGFLEEHDESPRKEYPVARWNVRLDGTTPSDEPEIGYPSPPRPEMGIRPESLDENPVDIRKVLYDAGVYYDDLDDVASLLDPEPEEPPTSPTLHQSECTPSQEDDGSTACQSNSITSHDDMDVDVDDHPASAPCTVGASSLAHATIALALKNLAEACPDLINPSSLPRLV